MPVKPIAVLRFSVVSSKPFESVLKSLEAAVGRPEIVSFVKSIGSAKDHAELEAIVNKAVGPAGLMEFIRFNLGDYIRKGRPEAPQSVRLVVGNPLIMEQMVVPIPDSGSYAPVTILVDERPDGVHLSYDRMVGFLAPYGNAEALKVAQDLDAKVETLLASAAA